MRERGFGCKGTHIGKSLWKLARVLEVAVMGVGVAVEMQVKEVEIVHSSCFSDLCAVNPPALCLIFPPQGLYYVGISVYQPPYTLFSGFLLASSGPVCDLFGLASAPNFEIPQVPHTLR